MIYTLRRKAWLYSYEFGKKIPNPGGPDHEAEMGDRFVLVGFIGGLSGNGVFAILGKMRGVNHGKLYAVPEEELRKLDLWYVIEGD